MHAAHERLRRAREAKGLTLAMLEQRTGVRQQVLSGIERAAFGDLPAGVYGRHALRAYARAVGVDADEVVSEVAPLLARVEDPLDGLARVRGLRRRRAPDLESPAARCEEAPARPISNAWRSLVAGMIDAGLFGGMTLVLLQLTAVAAGSDVGDVALSAAPAVVLLVLLIAGAYFVLLGGIANITLGARVLRVPATRPDGAATAQRILRRAVDCALRESALLVSLILWSAGRALNDVRRLAGAPHTCDTPRA